jgi:hypothetical protein
MRVTAVADALIGRGHLPSEQPSNFTSPFTPLPLCAHTRFGGVVAFFVSHTLIRRKVRRL